MIKRMSLDAKPRVVYLLGAGASAQTLPMVAQIPQALQAHYDWLWSYAKTAGKPKEMITGRPETERHKMLGEYLNIISELKAESANHESIDTYAKKLFLKSKTYSALRPKLQELKIGLALFMAYHQAKCKGADKRYDGFLASLLTHTQHGVLTLPPDVLVMNWNYDQQLAMAMTEYQHEGSVTGAIEQLGILPLEMLSTNFRHPCRSIHLNGMFAYHSEIDDIYPLVNWNSNNDDDLLDAVLLFYARYKYSGSIGPGRLLMRFAWEQSEKMTAAFKLLGSVLGNCEALVVIGYSFPFFNREVDREIIKHMPGLKHIYVQAPQKHAEEIARTVKTMNLPDGCEVETYGNTDKFFLPPEL